MEQRLFQMNLKALDAYPLKSVGNGHSTLVQPLLYYSTLMSATIEDYIRVYAG